MRRFPRVLLLLTLLLAAGLALAVALREDLAGRAVLMLGPRLGLPIVDARVERIGLTGAELRAVSLAEGGVQAERVELFWRPGVLVRERQLDRVRIEDATVRVEIAADGTVRLPGLLVPTDPTGGPGVAALPILPVAAVEIAASRLLLDSPIGPIEAGLDLWLVPDLTGGLALHGTTTPTHAVGQVAMPLAGRIGPDLSFEVSLEVRSDRLVQPPVELRGVAGWLDLDGAAGALTGISGELAVADLRLDDRSFEAIRLLIEGGAAVERLLLRGALPEEAARFAVDIALEGAAVRLEAALWSDRLEAVLADFGIAAPVTGGGRIDLATRLPLAADLMLEGLAGLDLAGTVSVGAEGLDWDGGGWAASLAAAAEWRFVDGRLVAQGRGPWRAALAEPPLEVLLEGSTGARQQLVLDGLLTADELDLSLRGGWTLLSEGPQVLGDLEVRLADGQIGLQRLDGRTAPLALPGGGDVTLPAFALAGAGSTDSFEADLVVTAQALGIDLAGVRIATGLADFAGALDWHQGRLVLRPDACLPLRLDGLAAAGGRVTDAVEICLEADADGLLRLATEGDGAAGWRAALAARADLPATVLRLEDGGRVRLTPGSVDLAAEIADDGMPSLALRGAGGGLRLDAPALEVTGIGWEAAWPAVAGQPVARLLQASLRLLDEPAPLRPLALSGALEERGETLHFTGRGIGAGGQPRLGLAARHAPATGQGRLDVVLDPVVFAPGDGPQPADLSPALAALRLTNVRGRAAAQGYLAWGGVGLRSGGRLDLADLAFLAPAASVVGLDAALTFDSLLPPIMPPGQRVTVGLIDPGVTLIDGEAEFALDDRGLVSVSRAAIGWAGGRLEARPFAYDPQQVDQRVILDARDINLAQVIAKVPLDGLFATGRASGVLPLRLSGDTILVEDAVLESHGPGQIRYVAETDLEAMAGGQGGDAIGLLMAALRDFQYDSLALRLSGQLGDDLLAGLTVRGGSPEVYGGYPVALNVSVSGALDQILRRSLEASRHVREAEEYLRKRAADILLQDLDIHSGL